MAYDSQTSLNVAYQAGENLSNNQWQFVRRKVDGLIYSCDDKVSPLGILVNQPSPTSQGQYAATVAMVGVTRLAVGAAYPIDTYLVPHTDGTTKGLGYSVADSSSSAEFIRARMLEPSNGAYEVVSVLLVDGALGLEGITGIVGPAGPAGATGMGAMGSQGVTGIHGIQGPQGVTGMP